jgi:polyisoprenoid-binding protein YceI
MIPILLALFSLGLTAAEKQLTFYPAKTTVQWTLGGTLHTVHGTFKFKSGSIQFDPAGGKASGELLVDAASGASGNGGRDSRMHKNVLESAKFPVISFTPERTEGKLAAAGPSAIQLHGSFKIHGTAHELTLPATVEAAGDTLQFRTTFTIPYVAWGMKSPSSFLLKVEDKVTITISGEGKLTNP